MRKYSEEEAYTFAARFEQEAKNMGEGMEILCGDEMIMNGYIGDYLSEHDLVVAVYNIEEKISYPEAS